MSQHHPQTARKQRRSTDRWHNREGVVLVLSVFLIIMMMAFLAFAVDLGYMMTVQTEMDRAVDAAALAGAGALIDGTEEARQQSLDYMLRNRVGSQHLADEDDRGEKLDQWLGDNGDNFKVEVGHWNPASRQFSASNNLPSAVKVEATYEDAPLFFGRIFGQHAFDTKSEAIARYQPRDIILVLDFSGSMNDDSELRRIYEYGSDQRATIEANLLKIYQELGSPTAGSMGFEPRYISTTSNYWIKRNLGIDSVSYPFPSGSWDDYIDYMKSDYGYPARAGYKKKYGFLTLINYWLEKKPKYSQTPVLWQVSAQPVTAVKDAVKIFVDYIEEVECDDKMALAIYNSTSQDALIEQELTKDTDLIEDIVTHRQAAHYDSYTNIGAGIRVGWEELDDHSRIGSKKLIILMTDGIANRPSSTSYGRSYALQQATMASEKGYPIVTISLGNAADKNLMQQIADISGGVHFNIPGGNDVVDYEEDLLEVFRKIADDRPLVLVK